MRTANNTNNKITDDAICNNGEKSSSLSRVELKGERFITHVDLSDPIMVSFSIVLSFIVIFISQAIINLFIIDGC